MVTKFVDLQNGSDSNGGTSKADAYKTINKGMTGLTTSDFVRVMGSLPQTKLDQTAVWTNQSLAVTLSASANTSAIYSDGTWTALTNITCTTDAVNKKEGSNSASISAAAAFTTGQMAYFATGTLNLSAFTQISFWIKPSVATAANTLRIDLCSDTIGAVAIYSFTIPYALDSARWHPITLPPNSWSSGKMSLATAIASINMQALLDPGTNVILIDNVFAALDPGDTNVLTLNTLIGKNVNTGLDNANFWFPLKSIVSTTLTIDLDSQSLQAAGRGFYGTTATASIWTKSCIVITATDNQANTGPQVSGGWNRTDMTTQDSTVGTFVDTLGRAFVWAAAGGTNNQWFQYFGIVRTTSGFFVITNSNTNLAPIKNCWIVSCSNPFSNNVHSFDGCYLISSSALGSGGSQGNASNSYIISCGSNSAIQLATTMANYIDNVSILNCAGPGLAIAGGRNMRLRNITVGYSSTSGITNSGDTTIDGLTCTNNGTVGIDDLATSGGLLKVFNYTASGNTTADVRLASQSGGTVFLQNANMTSSTPVTSTAGNNGMLISQREGGVSTVNKVYLSWNTSAVAISTSTAVTHSGTFSWKFVPPNSTGFIATNPMSWKLGSVACLANQLTTATFWAVKDNAAITMALKIPGGRYPGVGSIGTDITSAVTPATDGVTWSQYSISWTATENCVVEIFADTYSTNTTAAGYIDGLVTVL